MFGFSYSRAVLESFEHPLHAGRARGDPAELIVGRAGSMKAGALVELSLRVAPGGVTEARFRAFGCPHTIAAASRVAQQIEGQPIEALEGFDIQAIADELEVPAGKLGRLLIVADALVGCLAEWRRRPPGTDTKQR
ncbi:MAG: iron-sulfur cluster assembly scaffold protein [Gammaproteobacteria bacterium]|nr:iron-sulfur cluster assembly scaffold protein [Gammaproteobacteria bacterium]